MDSKFKINKKVLYDVILTSPFVQFFLKRQVFFFLYETISTPNLVQFRSKKAKLRRGEGDSAPQVENVLNRPGEMGLNFHSSKKMNDENWHCQYAPVRI